MTNARRAMGVLTLVAAGMMTATGAASQQAATRTEDPKSTTETRWAHCLVRIAGQSNVISFSDVIVQRFIYGDNARNRVIKEVFGTIPEAAYGSSSRFVDLQTLERQVSEPSNEISILLSLGVSLPSGVKPAAEEFLQALVANFRTAIAAIYRSESNRLEEQVWLTQREIEYADAELRDIQQRLMESSDRDSSFETLRSNITAITSQLQGLQLEKASQEAYRQGISKRISEIRDEVEKTLHRDAITAELEQIVQRRTAELKDARAMVDTGMVAVSGLADLEYKLAAARIDLARRREELGKTASAASLGQLTNELTTLTLEAERMQARENQLNTQLDRTRALMGQAGEYERLMLKLDIAKQNLREAETLNSKARQRARMLQMPSITIIGD